MQENSRNIWSSKERSQRSNTVPCITNQSVAEVVKQRRAEHTQGHGCDLIFRLTLESLFSLFPGSTRHLLQVKHVCLTIY